LNNRVNNKATENIQGGIALVANTTGVVDNNFVFVAYATDNTTLIDAASCALGLNWVSNVVSEVPVVHGTLEAGSPEYKLDLIVAQTTVREVTGDADTDDDQADYTTYQTLMTVTAPATGLMDCTIDLDFNKASTGWDTVYTAADTLDVIVVKQVNGSDYRATQSASMQITANGNGTLDDTESGWSYRVGPMQTNCSVQIKIKVSQERGDCVIPYRVTSVGAAPTIVAVEAGA
ncbi:unnamed protein product, partial [marine sediment metagenome]